MATKTISLSEDAYERLKSLKEDKESFSDVVRKMTNSVDLSEYQGALSEETAEELEEAIEDRRKRTGKEHKKRTDRIAEELE